MDILEQTVDRLVLKTRNNKFTWIWLLVLLAVAALVQTKAVTIDGSTNTVWQTIIPVGIILLVLYRAISIHTSVLTLDRNAELLHVTQNYLFGIAPRTSTMSFSDVRQFIIKAYRSNANTISSGLSFIFKSDMNKIVIDMDALHFGEAANSTNPSESNERAIGTYIAEIIGVTIEENAKYLNSSRILIRILSTAAIVIAGITITLLIIR